jgi:hypothetical protein
LDRTNVIIVLILFIFIACSALADGASVESVVALGACFAVPAGFGRILWSEQPSSEYGAWLLIAIAAIVIWYVQSALAAMYAGLFVFGQIVGRVAGSIFFWK